MYKMDVINCLKLFSFYAHRYYNRLVQYVLTYVGDLNTRLQSPKTKPIPKHFLLILFSSKLSSDSSPLKTLESKAFMRSLLRNYKLKTES